jgi:hypothetical protein
MISMRILKNPSRRRRHNRFMVCHSRESEGLGGKVGDYVAAGGGGGGESAVVEGGRGGEET